MHRFFKENFALSAGIALPLILVLLFLFAGFLGRDLTPDPQYDAIFAVNYGGNSVDNGYRIDIIDGKLVITKKQDLEKLPRQYNPTRIFHYDHKTRYATQLNINFDHLNADNVVSDALIDQLNKVKLDPSNVSPDGFHFEYKESYTDQSLFTEIFANRRSFYMLTNGTKEVPIRSDESFTQTFFLGWIEP